MKIVVALLVTVILTIGPNHLNGLGMALAQDQVVLKGQLSGRSGHKVSGTVHIVKTNSGYRVQFQKNFKLDGAPGPYLGFGNGGKYKRSKEFSKLHKNRGSQTCKIPNRVDVSKFDTFIIWCKPYKVPLAIARLQ